jgi:type IV secretory pathway TrbF-like protein
MIETPTNGVPASEIAALQAAYEVIQRRDGRAEQRAFQWKLVAIAMMVINAAIGIVDHLDRRGTFKALVQTVQVNEDGKVVHLGEPQDFLSYAPQEGHWHDMLTRWVVSARWRSGEPVVTKRDWGWAYVHTCGAARRLLQAAEEQDKPFAPSKRVVSVEVKSVTKSPAPHNYQVLWSETTVDPALPVKTQQYTGTFVVGRYTPPTQAALMHNKLGLCVVAYDLTPQP